jgi:hypothetical protein
VDQEIELADPNLIPLAPEEVAEAVRLLAVLIRAAQARLPDSTFPCPRVSPSSEGLANGSPFVPRDGGKARPAEDAGGGL